MTAYQKETQKLREAELRRYDLHEESVALNGLIDEVMDGKVRLNPARAAVRIQALSRGFAHRAGALQPHPLGPKGGR